MDPMFESIKDEPAIVQAFITTIWFLSVIPVVAFPYAVVLSALDLSMEVAAGILPTAVGHKLLFNSKWEPAWSRAMEHLGRLAPFLLLLIPAVPSMAISVDWWVGPLRPQSFLRWRRGASVRFWGRMLGRLLWGG